MFVCYACCEVIEVDYIKNGSITTQGRTQNLKPYETFQVEVKFNNMEEVPLVYELPANNSGSITPEGLYTAPNREGSFEIRVSCSDYPQIFAYVYVSVDF